MTQKPILQLLVFFVLACGFTFLASKIGAGTVWRIDLGLVLCSLGPLLSGLICYRLFKTENTYKISLGGVRPMLIFPIFSISILLPILLFKGASIQEIVSAIVLQLVLAFCEEFGWRHYLLNVTSSFNRWLQALIIGTIWVFWHFSFNSAPVKAILGQDFPLIPGLAISVALLSVLALLWGDLVMKTRSLLVPITAHSVLKFGDPISIGVAVILLHSVQLFWKRLKPSA